MVAIGCVDRQRCAGSRGEWIAGWCTLLGEHLFAENVPEGQRPFLMPPTPVLSLANRCAISRRPYQPPVGLSARCARREPPRLGPLSSSASRRASSEHHVASILLRRLVGVPSP